MEQLGCLGVDARDLRLENGAEQVKSERSSGGKFRPLANVIAGGFENGCAVFGVVEVDWCQDTDQLLEEMDEGQSGQQDQRFLKVSSRKTGIFDLAEINEAPVVAGVGRLGWRTGGVEASMGRTEQGRWGGGSDA